MELPSLADRRRDYASMRLDQRDVAADPIIQFGRWMHQALEAQLVEPTAMTLATATADGLPSARIVLLKEVDERGFVFFTDYRSRKGRELDDNPHAALVLYWAELERQVRIVGRVERVSEAESAAYFARRPRPSRLSAWASHQSSALADRAALEQRLAKTIERFPEGDVPLPPYWGGFRVIPGEIEFWQGREDRLHDRIVYRRSPDGWTAGRLSP